MLRHRIKNFLRNCILYGFRETIKMAVRRRLECFRSLILKDVLYYDYHYHDDHPQNKKSLNYVENNTKKFRFDYWKLRERQGI